MPVPANPSVSARRTGPATSEPVNAGLTAAGATRVSPSTADGSFVAAACWVLATCVPSTLTAGPAGGGAAWEGCSDGGGTTGGMGS